MHLILNIMLHSTRYQTAKYTSLYGTKYTLMYTSDCTRLYTPSLVELHLPGSSQDVLKYTANCTWQSQPAWLYASKTSPKTLASTHRVRFQVHCQVHFHVHSRSSSQGHSKFHVGLTVRSQLHLMMHSHPAWLYAAKWALKTHLRRLHLRSHDYLWVHYCVYSQA